MQLLNASNALLEYIERSSNDKNLFIEEEKYIFVDITLQRFLSKITIYPHKM